MLGFGLVLFFLVLMTNTLPLPSPPCQSSLFGFQIIIWLLYLCLSSQTQAPWNWFHSCWSTKFHSTRPHPCTDTSLTVLSPPSSVRVRLPCLAGCPSGTSVEQQPLGNAPVASVWPPSHLPPLDQAIPSQCSAQFYSETHPRPVSSHRLFPDKFPTRLFLVEGITEVL